jgi:hypothetical protein
MSIDRCKAVREIIDSYFTGIHERVTGDEAEINGIYTVKTRAVTFERAKELRTVVGGAIASAGFSIVDAAVELHSDPGTGDTYGALIFRVGVADVRAL